MSKGEGSPSTPDGEVKPGLADELESHLSAMKRLLGSLADHHEQATYCADMLAQDALAESASKSETSTRDDPENVEAMKEELAKIAVALGRSKDGTGTDCDWAFIGEEVQELVKAAPRSGRPDIPARTGEGSAVVAACDKHAGVKRIRIQGGAGFGDWEAVEHPDGQYVSHTDYRQLERELAEYKARAESAEIAQVEASMREPDNIGATDRWEDPRDLSGGETDCAPSAKPTPEGRGSPPAGALESGSPYDAARDATPGGAAPGGVASSSAASSHVPEWCTRENITELCYRLETLDPSRERAVRDLRDLALRALAAPSSAVPLIEKIEELQRAVPPEEWDKLPPVMESCGGAGRNAALGVRPQFPTHAPVSHASSNDVLRSLVARVQALLAEVEADYIHLPAPADQIRAHARRQGRRQGEIVGAKLAIAEVVLVDAAASATRRSDE